MLVDNKQGMPEEVRHMCACIVQEMFALDFPAELMAQWLASFVEAGADVSDMSAFWIATLNRASDIIRNEEVWDEITPGYPGPYKWSFVLREQYPPQDETLGNPENIVLGYKVSVYIGDDVYFSDSLEVFKDEHGVQWAKFIASNGPAMGKEMMMRTDGLKMIVRDA